MLIVLIFSITETPVMFSINKFKTFLEKYGNILMMVQDTHL
jgi:hypothetical protein